ncbi:MAG: DUF2892 domain-containing protein [Gammaproteobacteria bacterium]|jgi:hypothetical protein|nr:MAG: DUF2892 domain-containing protein [Gammaproteobacteria bacterium]
MSERVFRFILGTVLMLLLLLQQDQLILVYMGILLFEGITNLRIPILVSRVRYGAAYGAVQPADSGCSKIPFDAERALRLIVVAMLVVSFVMYREQIWFFPWFIGFMLFMAGMTNICPMVMGLRWIGFR